MWLTSIEDCPIDAHVSVYGVVDRIELSFLNVEDDVIIFVRSATGNETSVGIPLLAYEELFEDKIRVGTSGCFQGLIKPYDETGNEKYVKFMRFIEICNSEMKI